MPLVSLLCPRPRPISFTFMKIVERDNDVDIAIDLHLRNLFFTKSSTPVIVRRIKKQFMNLLYLAFPCSILLF